MPLARIVATNPGAARETALALRQAGYQVEIVPPGTPATFAVDLEFDADSDTVISQKEQEYTPGQREFVLKPLWRKLTARYHANRDVARAQQVTPTTISKTRPVAESRAVAPSAPQRHEERAADEAAAAAVEQERIEKEEARRIEQLRLQREREEQAAVRLREMEIRRAEEQRAQQAREEWEANRQRELAAQRAELERQQELHRQQEVARQREYQQQQLALKRQEESRQLAEEARRAEEAEAAKQARLAQEREGLRQQEALRRKMEEEHRLAVLRKREEEERERRAAAQELLLVANKQKGESVRDREVTAIVSNAPPASTVPTFRQYAGLRWSNWKSARAAAREARLSSKVTRIDRSSAFAWRQAWPITAGVAAAFLLGWGIAAYHSPAPKAVSSQPPVLAPGQYAPYPVATNAVNKKAPASAAKPAARKRVARDQAVAEDEVITHHYYPSKAATAQNRTPQRKKISDLQ